ncbi:MAG TPA: prepilin-type N-terminal cleavage/methylation domain-containing protein, partial [Candidatus Saccharimonadaceae bacterium]|nr:prepilin-type N-terminal cleavage/methylation domain-containing protein [Candidatus Saccharimonadaceae bacterium]
QAGFTILEVMLVLAITGLMLIGVMAGASAQVTQQEYRDSVRSLQGELQTQYTDVQNPTIDRTLGEGATPGGPCGGTSSRGTSQDCFVVGRLVTSSGGQVLTEQPVLGVPPSASDSSTPIGSTTVPAPNAPAPSPKQWELIIDNDSSVVSKYTVNWGATIKIPVITGAQPSQDFSILVIMSPFDGSLQTYTNLTRAVVSSSDVYKMIQATTQQDANLCVTGGGSAIIGTPLAVQVPLDASSAAGVTMVSQSQGVCNGIS